MNGLCLKYINWYFCIIQVNASKSCNAIMSRTKVLELPSVWADIIVTPHVGDAFFKRHLWGTMLLSHFGSFLRIRMIMTEEPWRSMLFSTLKSRRPTRYGSIFCFSFHVDAVFSLWHYFCTKKFTLLLLLFFELNARKGKDCLCVRV